MEWTWNGSNRVEVEIYDRGTDVGMGKRMRWMNRGSMPDHPVIYG